MTDIVFHIADGEYKADVCFKTIEAVEAELGPCVRLLARLQSADWTVTEVVQFIHIVVNDDRLDFEELGNEVVRTGATRFFDPVLKILMTAVFGPMPKR